LKELQAERENIIRERLEEIERLKEEKKLLLDSMENNRKSVEEKNKFKQDKLAELEEEKTKVTHAEDTLSRIVLLLKLFVKDLFPEKKISDVSIKTAERYMTLCGLSLEQKATILSFRNRNFPIESINEDKANVPQKAEEKKEEDKKDEAFENELEKEKALNEKTRQMIKSGKNDVESNYTIKI
jgi:hypothetical protein